MEEIKIEVADLDKKTIVIFTYHGEGDPVRKIDSVIKEYTVGKKYREFVDADMDNPWVRIVVIGELY